LVSVLLLIRSRAHSDPTHKEAVKIWAKCRNAYHVGTVVTSCLDC
jgi:hypothetical protein